MSPSNNNNNTSYRIGNFYGLGYRNLNRSCIRPTKKGNIYTIWLNQITGIIKNSDFYFFPRIYFHSFALTWFSIDSPYYNFFIYFFASSQYQVLITLEYGWINIVRLTYFANMFLLCLPLYLGLLCSVWIESVRMCPFLMHLKWTFVWR